MSLLLTSDGILTDTTGLIESNPLWTPAMQAGIFFDLSCEAGLTLGGSTITQAVDQVSGYVMTPSDTGAPLVEGAAMGGHTPIHLTGGHGLQTPDMGTRDVPWFAMMLRVNAVGGADEQLFFLNSDGTVGAIILRASSALNGEPSIQYTGGQIRSGQQSGQTIPTGYVLLACFFDQATGLARLRVNGGDYNTNNTDHLPTGVPFHGGQIGRYGNPTLGMNDTSLARFVFGEGALSLTQAQKLEGALAQRYAPANLLSAGHPYRTVAPRRLS